MHPKHLILAASLIVTSTAFSKATSLNIGVDYLLRGVTIESNDNRFRSNAYYDQRIQTYITADLSKDVEASLQLQSITPFGQENSTTTLTTPYPDGDGNLWVQNAYIRLPNIWEKRIIITLGRQPIEWGDGEILSDNNMGLNAIRGQITSPFRWLPIDLEGFTAKLSEGFQTKQDADLHGAVLGFYRQAVRWEIIGLWENSKANQSYQVGGSTLPFTADGIKRNIYGISAKANLRDAFLKGAYYIQGGEVTPVGGGVKTDLGGSAYMIGLGGKQDTKKIGRFGAILEFMEASGDKSSTPGKDEAFRPTFAKRWDGLERTGQGQYFAASLSDAYNPASPFAPVSATNTGLPPGTSGLQTIHGGVELTPWAAWTFNLDWFQYKARNNISGPKDLGTEIDYGVVYRYSGLVTFKASGGRFNPKAGFDEATRQSATFARGEAQIRF